MNKDLAECYLKALSNYRNKNFDEAVKYWSECLTKNPNDKASKIMLNRTLKFKQEGISQDWKPIWAVENK